jgi:hypothetical protein
MRMLNNGRRITATGNSDSHHLVFREPGYPRNYVASDAGPFSHASEDALVESVRAGRVFVTYGPILDFRLNGAGLGDQVGTVDGEVRASVRVRCASWMNAKTATLYANSRPVATIALDPGDGAPQDVTVSWVDRPAVDTWYLVFVDGDEDLFPVRRGFGFRPLAFTNPIRVDVDGDGAFTPPGNLASVEPIEDVDRVDAQGVPLRLGEFVAVVGCATTDTRFGDPSLGVFYLEDGTGGIRVREQVETTTEIRRGDTVWAGGVLSQQLGETVLTDVQVDVLESGGVCSEGIPITTGEVAAGVEALEGRVVRISGANVTSGSWPAGGAEGAVVLDDGSGAVSLIVPTGVVVPAEASELKDFELTAIVSQRDFAPPFTSGYHLLLRDGADLFGEGAGAGRGALEGIRLGRPHPNPFRGSVTIPVFAAPSPTPAKIEIFDVTGRRVSEQVVPPNGRLEWDGTDTRGRRVPAGVYFVRPLGHTRVGATRLVKLD